MQCDAERAWLSSLGSWGFPLLSFVAIPSAPEQGSPSQQKPWWLEGFQSSAVKTQEEGHDVLIITALDDMGSNQDLGKRKGAEELSIEGVRFPSASWKLFLPLLIFPLEAMTVLSQPL